MSKYHNKKVEHDGIKFDSISEGQRYLFLKSQQEKGNIQDLQCHVKYTLIPAEYEDVHKQLKTKVKIVRKQVKKPVVYTPDFVYTKDGETKVEDFKGNERVVSKDFPLRVRMMDYLLKINVRVVTKPTEPV